jgi:peroxiredoxin
MPASDPVPDPTRHLRLPLVATVVVATGAVIMAYLMVTNFSPARLEKRDRTEAESAADYLRDRGVAPLSGPLKSVLADSKKPRVPTEKHPLLNQAAPAFQRPDVDGQAVSLEGLLAKGPVVLVFYYGYTCNHCVAQLFGLNDDLKYFRELNATVVAVSPDAADKTRERYAKYGAFGFPVLSDPEPERAVAARYGVFRPAVGPTPEWQAHGTFVIDRGGVVRWANTGDEPFTDTATLLAELARLEGSQ